MKPLISVITPVYKAEKYIARSLHSLFGQTMTAGVEFILVDDCSPDDSIAIALKVAAQYPHLAGQIIVLRHERNSGSAVASQTGLDRAEGEWVIQIDSDDWCEPAMLEQLYASAVESGADIVVCDYYFNVPGRQTYHRQAAPENSSEALGMLLDGTLHGAKWNKLVRRRLITENGVAFLPGVDIWEDLLFNTKLFHFADRIAYVPQAFLHYMQVNPASLTSPSSLASEKFLRDTTRIIAEIERFLEAHGQKELHRTALIYRKLHARNNYLRHAGPRKQREPGSLYAGFPREYILSVPGLPAYYRHALWLAESRHTLWLANMIYRSVDVAKRIVR